MNRLEFFITLFVITFFYVNSVIKVMVLNEISERNKRIKGALIWLNLLPFINLVFPFIYNHALNDSVKNELQDSGEKISFFYYPGNLYPVLILVSIPYYLKILSTGSIEALTQFETAFFLFMMVSVFFFWSLYLSELTAIRKFIIRGRKGKQMSYMLIFWGISIIVFSLLSIYQNSFSLEAIGVGLKIN